MSYLKSKPKVNLTIRVDPDLKKRLKDAGIDFTKLLTPTLIQADGGIYIIQTPSAQTIGPEKK